MSNGFFVTGTGTGVGKTFVSTLLAEQARSGGARVFAFKPIETGCSKRGEDQERLAKAAGDWQAGELRNLYCFEEPVAPYAAAKAEARVIALDRIERVFREGCARADFVIVEGAGGWRVPITEKDDMGALARRLGLPVLVVATAALGTINHSVLTVEAVRRDGLEVESLILSVRPEDELAFAHQNAVEIRRMAKCRVELSSALSCFT